MEWYYAEGGQRVGPISQPELQALHETGRVRPETLVWSAGMPEWVEFRTVPLRDAAPEGRFCTECGRELDPADLLAFGDRRVCAGCKDAFFQRVREQGTTAGTNRFIRYGGFWIRFLARVIDGLITSAVFVVLIFLWTVAMRNALPRPGETPNIRSVAAIWGGLILIYLLSTAFFLLYEAWFLAKREGTPGKLALGLKVVRSNGDKLTPGRSTGRAFAYLLNSLIPLLIGFIIAGFDDQKRSLHDHICDTRVVYKSP